MPRNIGQLAKTPMTHPNLLSSNALRQSHGPCLVRQLCDMIVVADT